MSDMDSGKRGEPKISDTVMTGPGRATSRSRAWVFAVPGLFAGAGLVILAAVFWPGAASWVATAPEVQEQTPQTEAVFVQRVSSSGQSSAVMNEWRAARQEHKNVAFAIAECDRFDDIDNMPRSVFSRLLLDLSPIGQHEFPPEPLLKTNTTLGAPSGSAAHPAAHTIQLVGLQAAMLVLSDEVARARLEAARAANGALPGVTTLSWFTIGFTAMTTLLISLRPMIEGKQLASSIALLTIMASVGSTSLTSVKAIYDPGQAYAANSQALVKLQNLHRQIALRLATDYPPGGCVSAADATQVSALRKVGSPPDPDGPHRERLEAWAKQLDDIENTITPATVVVPNSSTPQNAPQTPALAPAAQPRPAAAPPGPNLTSQ